MRDAAPSLVLSGDCLLVQERTGRQCVARFEQHRLDGRCWVEVTFDGRRQEDKPVAAEVVAWWEEGAFPEPGGGGTRAEVVRDPVNLNGSPRNALRDRPARKRLGEPEAMAAD